MKELHQSTLYRTQRLIRMGEWLERNSAAICLAFEVIDRAHDLMLESPEDMSCSDILEQASAQQMSAIRALLPILGEMHSCKDWDVEMGQDVTIHQPNACLGHRYEVVIEAPKPSDTVYKSEANNADS